MQRNFVLDITKLVLAGMVVCLHCWVLFEQSYALSNFLHNYVFRVAVPVFFIINGYYYFGVQSNALWGWFSRLVVMYVFWEIVYLPFYWGEISSVPALMKFVFYGYWHLWYLSATLMAGLSFLYLKKVGTKTLVLLMLCLYCIGLFVQYSGRYHLFVGSSLDDVFNKVSVSRNFLFFGLPMFSIGYLMAKYQVPRVYSNLVSPVFFVGLLGMLLEYWLNTVFLLGWAEFDLLFFVPFAAAFVFMFAIQRAEKTKTAYFSQLATAIYLVHPLLIWLLKEVMEVKSNNVLAATVLVLCFSVGSVLVVINKKARFLV